MGFVYIDFAVSHLNSGTRTLARLHRTFTGDFNSQVHKFHHFAPLHVFFWDPSRSFLSLLLRGSCSLSHDVGLLAVEVVVVVVWVFLIFDLFPFFFFTFGFLRASCGASIFISLISSFVSFTSMICSISKSEEDVSSQSLSFSSVWDALRRVAYSELSHPTRHFFKSLHF